MTRLGWTLGLACIGSLLPTAAKAERIIFLNTEPTQLVDTAGQDPTMDSYTSNGFTPGLISGWPALTDQQRDELVYWMKEATVPFDVIFTFSRPRNVPYDMLVMGDEASNTALFDIGCSAAIGLADCDDVQAENISFLFWGCMNEQQQMDMKRVAFNALTAIGFGWGLESVTATGQICGGYTANGLQFGDTCVATSATTCPTHVGCSAGQQNSSADITARIGARVDDGPPVVTITSPTPGDNPSSFTVAADVADSFGGLAVTLDIVEAAQEMDDDFPPYEWNLENVPPGQWTLQVTVTDADLNEVTETVSVCVDDPTCSTGGSTSTGGGDTTGAADTAGTYGDDIFPETTSDGGGTTTGTPGMSTSGPIDPTVPASGTTFGMQDAETGCGCRSEGGAPTGWLALLVLLSVSRRRVTRDE